MLVPQDADAASQRRAVSLLAATKRILEMIVAGASLTDERRQGE